MYWDMHIYADRYVMEAYREVKYHDEIQLVCMCILSSESYRWQTHRTLPTWYLRSHNSTQQLLEVIVSILDVRLEVHVWRFLFEGGSIVRLLLLWKNSQS